MTPLDDAIVTQFPLMPDERQVITITYLHQKGS